jgi:hypothetical protein
MTVDITPEAVERMADEIDAQFCKLCGHSAASLEAKTLRALAAENAALRARLDDCAAWVMAEEEGR